MGKSTLGKVESTGDQLPDDIELFDKRTAPVVETPQVTEQANGNFSMNHPAFKFLGEPEAIEYLYSQKTGVLVFRLLRYSIASGSPKNLKAGWFMEKFPFACSVTWGVSTTGAVRLSNSSMSSGN